MGGLNGLPEEKAVRARGGAKRYPFLSRAKLVLLDDSYIRVGCSPVLFDGLVLQRRFRDDIRLVISSRETSFWRE
jgi:hypothetical protein